MTFRRRIAGIAVAALAAAVPTDAHALAGASPFSTGARVAINDDGLAVVAWQGPDGVRATFGTRNDAFATPTVLSTDSDTFASPQAAIDAAGDALVVWETVRTESPACGHC